MGIESDQVVYEYLSRVGDVAQQRQLPSSTRMRLVNELRGEIDRRRAKAPVDNPAAVRRIIARLGTPDEVVTAAGGTSSGGGTASAPRPPVAPVPVQPTSRDEDAGERRPKGRLRRIVPRPRPAEPTAARDDAPAPPHLASTADLGDSAVQPDWWRVDSSPFGPGEDVPGFVGGIEIPEMLRRPPAKDETPRKPEPAEEPAVLEKAEEDEPKGRRRFLRRPTLPSGRWSNPLLLIAAALLVAGAVLGNLLALLLGWLIAWGSRRLSDAETKWAVIILPALSLTAGVVWLWGRTNDRWGAPITEGHTNTAIAETWPWVLRAAAVASALFIVWRSQKQR